MSEVIPGGTVKGVTVIGYTDANGKAVGVSETTPFVVESSTSLITTMSYTAGLLTSYVEQRGSDSKTRTVTITRNGDGTIATQAASAWA